jgi:hypothetical protein
MARKKAIAQSVAATKASQAGALDRPLVPKVVSAAEVAAEAIAKLMYAGQWDSTSREATMKELGCSLATFGKYERDAQRLVRMSMRHSSKAFERLSGVLNEVIDRSLEDGDLRTTVMAAGKLADITGLNKQVIEHREGDKLEEFRRRAMAGEDVEQLAREATEFLLGIESGVMYQ